MRVTRILDEFGLRPRRPYPPGAAERGRTVHTIAETIANGQPVTVAPGFEGYAEAVRQGLAALELVPVAVERRVTDAVVSGRIDAVGQTRLGPAVVDFKSGDAEPWHALQSAFYVGLAEAAGYRNDMAGPASAMPWRRLNLYVTADGTFRIREWADRHDFEVRDSIYKILRWRLAQGLLAPWEAEDDPVEVFA